MHTVAILDPNLVSKLSWFPLHLTSDDTDSLALQVFTGIRQLLHLEATKRPCMAAVHRWLGLVINGLNDPMGKRGQSFQYEHDAPATNQRLPDSPGRARTSTGTQTEANLAGPAAFPNDFAKGEVFTPLYLPPPPSFPVVGTKDGPELRPPPGFAPIGARKDPYCPLPLAEEVVIPHHGSLDRPPLALVSSEEAFGVENEARIPTSMAHGGEIESCPSTTSTVAAETEGMPGFASRLERPSGVPFEEGDGAVSAQDGGGGEALAAAGETPRAAHRARKSSATYGKGNERCSRPRTAEQEMSFPVALRQHDVMPRISGVTFFDMTHQRAKPATGRVNERGVPYASQASNPAVPPAYNHRAAPPPSTRGGYGVSAAGFGGEGDLTSHPPRRGHRGEQGNGRWADHEAGGRGFGWQDGSEIPGRYHTGAVQEHWQQLEGRSSDRKNTNRHRHHHLRQYQHKYIDPAVRAVASGKVGMKAARNRRGGRNIRRPDHPQQAAGYRAVVGCHAGVAVPHAIAVNWAPAFHPGGGAFYPWQWQRHPEGAW